MRLLNPRNRLIYFRVSEEEFQRFASLCERHRSRNMSELARRAMERLLSEAAAESTAADVNMDSLTHLIARLSSQLDIFIQTASTLNEKHASRPGDAAAAAEGSCGTEQ